MSQELHDHPGFHQPPRPREGASATTPTAAKATAIDDAVRRYFPAFLRQRAGVIGADTAAYAETFPAVVLRADITGFTSLTERLARSGIAGTEKLTQYLDASFAGVTRLISDHGGEVVQFAGDALFACWPLDSDTPAELLAAIDLAAACGLRIQNDLASKPADPESKVSMRLAVAAGVLRVFATGGAGDRWMFGWTGEPLDATRQGLPLAAPGELVVPARLTLGPAWSGRPVSRDPRWQTLTARSGTPLPAPPPLPPTPPPDAVAGTHVLLRFVPSSIRDRVAGGLAGWMAEFRRITVLFVRIPLPEAKAGDDDVIRPLVRELQQVLDRFQGSIDKLSLDFDGVALLAAFGVPGATHEDDPARALQAALGMRRRIGELGYECHAGIATGRAFCGEIGGVERRETTFIGEVVNLAARLMVSQAAPVVCDEATARAAGHRVALLPKPPIRLKGVGEPVPIFEPLQEIDSDRAQVRLIGRLRESARLVEPLSGLATGGPGGLWLLEGEPGIGKSSLVAELQRRARSLPVRILATEGDPIEESTAYHPWRSLLAPWNRPAGTPVASQRQALLDELLGATPALQTAGSSLFSAEARRDALADLVVELLSEAAEHQPLLLVLEDLHWFDSASRRLALRVAREVRPLLVVATVRAAEWAANPDAGLWRDLAAGVLALGHMDETDILALVADKLGVDGPLPDPVARIILERGERHPFYSEQLALALRDAGLVRVEARTCRWAAGNLNQASIALPDTLEGIITSRIDRLPAADQMALKVASVIGRIFELRTLDDIHPVPENRSTLPESLDRLARNDLTPVHAREPEPAYIFKHAIAQEVSYSLLVLAQRRLLHEELARWIEERHSGNLTPHLAVLAHHWSRAASVPQAVHYLERAADHALGQFASVEVVRLLESALELAPPGSPEHSRERLARWHRQLARAQYQLGRLPACDLHTRASLAATGRPLPESLPRLALSLAGAVLRQVAHRLAGGRVVRRDPAERDLLQSRAELYELLGIRSYFEGQLPWLLFGIVAGLNAAERAGNPGQLANSSASTMLLAAALPGLRGLARLYEAQALATAAKSGDPLVQARVEEIRCITYAGLGRWEEARDALSRSTDVFRRAGHHRGYEECILNQAVIHLYRGEHHEAHAAFEELVRLGRRRGDLQTVSWGRLGLARVNLHRGNFQESLDGLATDAEAFEADTLSRIDLHGTRCWASARLGDLARAAESLRPVLHLVTTKPAAGYAVLWGYHGAAATALRLWKHAKATGAPDVRERRRDARAACRALQAFSLSLPVGTPRACLVGGSFAWIEGRTDRARKLWEAALAAATRLGMRCDQGFAHVRLARCAPSKPAAARHLDTAIDLFEACGAGYDLRLARNLRAGMDAGASLRPPGFFPDTSTPVSPPNPTPS